jgi:copper transporter 1
MSTSGTMGSSNTIMGTMMVFSNDNTAVSILSSAFSPTTTAQYVGTWFFVFVLAITWRALVFAQRKLDQYWTKKYASSQILIKDGQKGIHLANGSQAWRFSTNLPSAALAFVTETVAYLL